MPAPVETLAGTLVSLSHSTSIVTNAPGAVLACSPSKSKNVESGIMKSEASSGIAGRSASELRTSSSPVRLNENSREAINSFP
jgi:hypothetical protein